MSLPTLVLLGPVGTRWLFGLIVVSALAAWGSETLMGVIEPSDRIAYPCIALSFTALGLLSWRQPQRLHLWQRGAVTLLALYFCISMLAFTLRGDPGPSLYTLGSIAPWSLGALLLLFGQAGRGLPQRLQPLRLALAGLELPSADHRHAQLTGHRFEVPDLDA